MAQAVRVVALPAAIKLFEIMLGPDAAAFQTDTGVIVLHNGIASLDLGEGLFDQFDFFWVPEWSRQHWFCSWFFSFFAYECNIDFKFAAFQSSSRQYEKVAQCIPLPVE
jgi:hypothetical protein